MLNRINIDTYLKRLKKNPSVDHMLRDKELGEGFALTKESVDGLGLAENQLLPNLLFVNISGSISLKGIGSLCNLHFSCNNTSASGKGLRITLEDVQLQTITLHNLKEKNVRISFKNVIADKIEIRRCKISSDQFDLLNSNVKEITISDTEFVYKEDSRNDPSILFSYSVLGQVHLERVKTVSDGGKVGEGKVHIENCFIENGLAIHSSPHLGDVFLLKGSINLNSWWKKQQAIPYDSLFAQLGTVQKLELSGSSVREMKVSNCNLKELIFVKSSLDVLSINQGSVLGRFSLYCDPAPEPCSANIGTFHIDNSTVEVLSINGNGHAAIANLSFTNALVRKGLITKNVCESICMEDLMMGESFLQISNTYTKKISFRDFNNLGVIHLINLGEKTDGELQDSVLELKNSTLGKVHFYGCNFSDYLEYESSSITDITVLSTEFPWQFREAEKGRSTYRKQKSLLGQLRRVYEQNNDVSNAIHYNAQQLDVIRKQSSLGWERFALWLNWGTNFYGSNLRRAFWVTFLGCLVLYLFYGAARGYIAFGTPNWEYFKYMLANFLEFISPVRRINLLKPVGAFGDLIWDPGKENIDFFTTFVSGISRLVISYLLVQFILAFRKYGRKA